MKYVIAILVCLAIIIVFQMIGIVAFGWEHGGGAIPQLFLFAIVILTFRAITKKPK